MLHPQKVIKDVRELADLVLMQEIRDTSIALQQLTQKQTVLQNEMNRRIDENIKVTGMEQRSHPTPTAQPAANGAAENK